jgi:hypothetical protein
MHEGASSGNEMRDTVMYEHLFTFVCEEYFINVRMVYHSFNTL